MSDTILMVEDNPEHSEQFVTACKVRFKEAQVIVARDGVQALSALRTGIKPRVILLDLELPQVNGFTVLETLRKEGLQKDVPVVIFTGHDTDAARYACERLGAVYFQLKPSSKTGFIAFATFLKTALENGGFAAP